MKVQRSTLKDIIEAVFSTSPNSIQFSMLVGFNLTTSYLCLIIINYCKHAEREGNFFYLQMSSLSIIC